MIADEPRVTMNGNRTMHRNKQDSQSELYFDNWSKPTVILAKGI